MRVVATAAAAAHAAGDVHCSITAVCTTLHSAAHVAAVAVQDPAQHAVSMGVPAKQNHTVPVALQVTVDIFTAVLLAIPSLQLGCLMLKCYRDTKYACN